jgi:hypothetical protein
METSDPFTNIRINDKDNYGVADYKDVSNGITNNQPDYITVARLEQGVFLPGEKTDYAIEFEPKNEIPTSGSVVIKWPEQITVVDGETYCQVTTTEVYDQKIIPDLCRFNFDTNTVYIKGVFDGSSEGFDGEVTVKLINIENPKDNREIKGFGIKTYSDPDSNNLIDTSTDGMLVPKLDCDYPCKSCVGSEDPLERAMCTSCWLGPYSDKPNFQPFFDSAGERLEHGVCQPQCDPGFSTDGKDTKICQQCAMYCDECDDENLNYCKTCDALFPYKVENTGICLEACKAGFYQSSDMSCSKCESPCATCEFTANTCTSCELDSGTPLLHKETSTCVEKCDLTFTPVNNVCEECESPCRTCFGAVDICTSCNGDFDLLYLDGNICKTKCDLGWVGDTRIDENYKCQKCEVAQCKVCNLEELDYCLECFEPFYIYEGQCVSECPTDYRVGDAGKACVLITINDLGILYFPFLQVTAILSLIVLFGKCKKAKPKGLKPAKSEQHSIPALIAVFGFMLYLALIAQAIWSWLFGTMNYFYFTVAIAGFMFVYNFVFFIVFRCLFFRTYVEADKVAKYKKG